MDLVSIAMATYNGERFIKEQLDSIYSQSYEKFEVVVCDDCSSDGTVAILDIYKKKHGLKYHVNKNRLGYKKNFEKAISLCRGKYIALADQDDIWDRGKLEILTAEIKGYPLAASDLALVDDRGTIISRSYESYRRRKIPDVPRQYESLIFSNYFPGCAMLLTAELARKVVPVPEEFSHHDWWISFQASLSGGIKYVNMPLVMYRQHGGNVLGPKKEKGLAFYAAKSVEVLFFFRKRIDEIRENFQDNYRRIDYCLKHKAFTTEEQRRMLVIAGDYYKSYLSGRVHLRTVYQGLKYGRCIFSGFTACSRVMRAMAKIF
jgi:glycosyltransferase involved in cell wall biosynthesis